jgi:Protein of unknown function (DUF3102)
MVDISSVLTNVNADLSVLAEQTRAHVQAGNLAVANGVAFWMAAGDTLLAAKAQIPHGGWLKHLKDCDLSEDKAERYMHLARHRAELENSARVRNLTLTGALRLINGAKPGRKSKPPVTVSKLDPLAWSNASTEERRRFLDAIGIDSVRKAMPPSWRSALEASVLEREVVPNPATTTEQTTAPSQDGLDIPEILRRELPPPSVSKTANTRLVDNAAEKVSELAKASSLPAPQINPSPPVKVRDDLFRDYRKLSADELEARVLTILRAAGRGQHFSPEQWDVVDRMRARAVELKRATSAQGQERTMTATA